MVLVQRAGDVIPEIVKPIVSKRDGTEIKFKMPQTCPVCGSQVVRIEGEAAVRCINASCSAQVKELIKHFASKGAFDIDGLGDKLIDQLVDKGILSSYADIFELDEETLSGLERMGAKSAHNIKGAIEQSQSVSFARFLFALGIRHVGEHVAGLLADRYNSLDDLMNSSSEDLEAVEGIGPVVAKSIASFFNQDRNRMTISQLLASGIHIESQTKKKTAKLEGKVLVLTGALESLTRSQAKEMIKACGGKVSESVSRNTDYVVTGHSPGSKIAKAKDLGIEIIDEAALKTLLGE
jgi:DNA ligase (NAD+)